MSAIWAMFSRVRSKTIGSSLVVEERLDLIARRRAARARSRSPPGPPVGKSDESSGSAVRGPTLPQSVTTPSLDELVDGRASSRPSSSCSTARGVLADPRHPRLGTLGHLRQLHRVAGDEHRRLDAVGARHLDEHVALLDVRVGDDVLRGLPGAAAMPAAVSFCDRFELGRAATPTPRPRAGSLSSRCAAHPRAWRSGGRSFHSGWSDELGELRSNWCSRTICITNVAVGRAEPLEITSSPCPVRAVRPIDQKLVTMSVIATIASNIAMSTCCPSPVRSRWRSAARMPITREQRRADVAERADRDRHAAARRPTSM